MMVHGKGRAGFREAAPLSRRTEQAIRAWLPNLPPDHSHLLIWRTRKTVRLHIVKLCVLAGVRYEGREVHGLRHTAGTRSYQESGDILEARDLLRHRDITSTQVYVQYARRGKNVLPVIALGVEQRDNQRQHGQCKGDGNVASHVGSAGQ